MSYNFYFFPAIVLCFLISFTSSYSGDFNIKLRKTDINELKQQLMPVFEENINILNKLLSCLEKGKTVDACLNDYSLLVDSKNESDKERNDQIRNNIKNKIAEKNIQQEKIISELKKLLFEAEKVTQCLHKGKTANELKDCVLLYDKNST